MQAYKEVGKLTQQVIHSSGQLLSSPPVDKWAAIGFNSQHLTILDKISRRNQRKEKKTLSRRGVFKKVRGRLTDSLFATIGVYGGVSLLSGFLQACNTQPTTLPPKPNALTQVPETVTTGASRVDPATGDRDTYSKEIPFAPDFVKIAEESVFEISLYHSGDINNKIGSGCVVKIEGNKYYLLTAAHIPNSILVKEHTSIDQLVLVRPNSNTPVLNTDYFRVYTAKTLDNSKQPIDVALIEFTLPEDQIVIPSIQSVPTKDITSLPQGTDVLCVGVPLIAIDPNGLNSTTYVSYGKVGINSDVTLNPPLTSSEFWINMASIGGLSGSPLIIKDQNGNPQVIAILSSSIEGVVLAPNYNNTQQLQPISVGVYLNMKDLYSQAQITK